MRFLPLVLSQIFLLCPSFAELECDPTSNTKKPDPSNPESYLYCNLEGHFTKRKCVSGKVFDAESGQCIALHQSDSPANDEEDPLSKPFYQAPDDLCGSGIPLTILSAPVACNPSISSCPDGYVCRMYERTGTSYCCQGSPIVTSGSSSQTMCGREQVTYIEPETGKPKACVLSDESSCPLGFGCTLIGGTATRCCGRDLGCPFNSAALLNSKSTSHVECSPNQKSTCQKGFSCVQSSTLNKHICCSNPEDMDDYECPNGDSPLPGSCSSSKPCPSGHACREGKCCPAAAVCPAGTPLGGGPTACSESNPCREGFECITNSGNQYCCPNREKVCSLPRHAGVACASSRSVVNKYYFDISTGACRSFKFSQCGGNSNNFNSLEECEGFCVDTQCKNGQAYRIGAVNAACDISSPNTCPRQHLCQTPIFGSNPICCPTAEMTCNEMVSAGTPCYGRSITMQRFYFNPLTRRCQGFQYYGCNGNGNNFGSMKECQNHCLNAVDNVCGGVSPLFDPNQQPQRCSEDVPCPSGYECNSEDYCCPVAKTACNAALSRGNVCSGTTSRSLWYYDNHSRKCQSFNYNGCGGTPNRFSSLKSCNELCVKTSNVLGACPRGMNVYYEKGNSVPKSCTLNVMGTCPSTASCVRSTTNQPICCQAVTSCPENRTPYVIPGSKSVVACNPDGDDCPDDNICVESSTVSGFHMCCSSSSSANQRPPSPIRGGKTRKEPETLAALIRSISTCPPTLQSNGHTCTVNGIGECPNNHICFRDVGFEEGTCCRTPPPKCAQKGFIPVFLEGTQVQICQVDLGGCPRDSRCMTSTVPRLAICCKKYEPPARPGQGGNHAKQVCKNGSPPFMNGGAAQECNFVHNTCPNGYKCEFSSTGRAVCCSDMEAIRCPMGSSVFEYGGRPLACPPGSSKCPMGYSCVPSMNPQHHLCCSISGANIKAVPQCTRGIAYVNPGTNERQYCSPILNNCPSGYHCLDSDHPGQYICCTQGDLNDRFKGFCPPRQIPHVSRDGYPPTCHMQLNPCPTTAPYVCIYSAEKQDSFCCAPIDTAVRTFIPDNVAARPMKKLGPDSTEIGGELPSQSFPGPNGMTQTFPGGPAVLGVGHVAVPDPIPGVSSDKILPPGMNIDSRFGNNAGHNTNAFNSANGQQPIIISVQSGGDALTAADFNRASTLNVGDNLRVNNLNSQTSGVITQFNGMGVSTPDFSFASGCPLGSRPLVRTDRSVAECSEQPCPEGFACVFAEAENRFQCCSSTSIMLASSNSMPKQDINEPVQQVGSSQLECPPGFYMIDGKCLKVLFAGQKGCLNDAQCSSKEPNSTCDSGYCVCPIDKPLVHGGRCISTCPEGFANIAGRCYDPTTVIFMDSVDERANGTIGGYCLETLVEEKRCDVSNAYCSEKTITCQCKPGFDLKMDFGNIEDKGVCEKIKSSKFQDDQPLAAPQQIDEELYFIDIGSASALEVGNGTANDDTEDLNKYLIQTDELIPVFA